MNTVYVIQERCPQDHSCPALPQCPTHAIIQHEYDAPEIMTDKCVSCGQCMKICPHKAFQVEK